MTTVISLPTGHIKFNIFSPHIFKSLLSGTFCYSSFMITMNVCSCALNRFWMKKHRTVTFLQKCFFLEIWSRQIEEFSHLFTFWTFQNYYRQPGIPGTLIQHTQIQCVVHISITYAFSTAFLMNNCTLILRLESTLLQSYKNVK